MTARNDRLFIGGQWIAAQGSEWIVAIDPATEDVVGYTRAGDTDMDKAVAAARAAFDTGPWPRMSHDERAAVIRTAAACLRDRVDEIAATITSEMGSPIAQSIAVQVPRAIQIGNSTPISHRAFSGRSGGRPTMPSMPATTCSSSTGRSVSWRRWCRGTARRS